MPSVIFPLSMLTLDPFPVAVSYFKAVQERLFLEGQWRNSKYLLKLIQTFSKNESAF
jgi:hypothetical protein